MLDALLVLAAVPLQEIPTVFGSPYDRLLVALVFAAGVVVVLRLLVDVAWKIVVAAAVAVALLGGASALGFV